MVDLFVEVLNEILLSRQNIRCYSTTKNNYPKTLMRLPVSASNSLQLLALLRSIIILAGAIGTNPLQHVRTLNVLLINSMIPL